MMHEACQEHAENVEHDQAKRDVRNHFVGLTDDIFAIALSALVLLVTGNLWP